MICSHRFSRAGHRLHILASSSDWLIGLVASVVIGQRNYIALDVGSPIFHSRVVLCLFFNARPRAQPLYWNEFYLRVNVKLFSYERLCAKNRFEKEVQDSSEMAY